MRGILPVNPSDYVIDFQYCSHKKLQFFDRNISVRSTFKKKERRSCSTLVTRMRQEPNCAKSQFHRATNSQKFQKLLKIEQMAVHYRHALHDAGCGYIDRSATHKEKIDC